MDAHVVSPVPKSQGGDKEKEKEKEKEKRRRKRGGRGTHGQAQVRTGIPSGERVVCEFEVLVSGVEMSGREKQQ